MLPDIRDYKKLRAAFRWQIPARYNIGVDACDKWAGREPDRTALLVHRAPGDIQPFTFGALRDQSNRLANALAAHGVARGDRIAIILPQSPETAVTHIAVYKLGAIAVPLAALFGVDALAYRLEDSGASAVVTNNAGLAKLTEIRERLPALKLVLCINGPGEKAPGFHDTLAQASADFSPVDTSPDDPALMVYTSGTTGQPKGALHDHRVLLGHFPGVEFHHEFFPQPGDRMWTPADWAWAGGLLNILLPGLAFGVPVVARKADKFDPGEAFALMAEAGVRNTFIPPTALRMLRGAGTPKEKLALRTVASGGEALGAETYEWGRSALGLTINEFYGQTECNIVLSSCAAIGVSKPGAIGLPVPGHEVAVIREDGTVCAPDETGEIAVRRPDPVMFLEYWKRPDATREKFIGDWMTTGDQGVADGDGYVRFVGRDDDVITSAGFRIGPTEIEDCLVRHPAVALAAAIGKPDELRTEIVKAFVVLKPGHAPTAALASEIQAFVRTRLSAHEYPREVEIVDEMPMTTTGKIIRRLLRDRA
jgi:acetyl-CoA synthetase